MIDFSKYTVGDIVIVHCCDECARRLDVNGYSISERGNWPCEACGHYGMGANVPLVITNWLILRALNG